MRCATCRCHQCHAGPLLHDCCMLPPACGGAAGLCQQLAAAGARKSRALADGVVTGFEVRDAIALLRLDDLYVECFEVKDVKVGRAAGG